MLRRSALVSAFLLVSFALSVSAEDQVIFKDGFTITGRRFKEQEAISDRTSGSTVVLPKARGFDIIQTGPKWILFSNKSQQVNKILENVKGESEMKEYVIPFAFKGNTPLPAGGIVKVGEFNDKWVRKIRVDMPAENKFAEIEQRIYSVGPKHLVMPSSNYQWYPFYDAKEFDPKMLRKFLSTHPELKQDAGKPDVSKLLDIAVYFKDAGMLDAAAKEIEDAKVTVPGAWAKELTERAENLAVEIKKARTEKQINEFERATRSGMYATAKQLLATIDDTQADAVSAKVLATARAEFETIVPRYEKARKLLRWALDATGGGVPPARGGLLGPMALVPAALPANVETLRAAAEEVFNELHPDSVERLDFFISLADQAQRKAAAGTDPGVKTANLLAFAVTGWLKGKNGAEENIDTANRYWRWRAMLISYQREKVLNNRRNILLKVQNSDGALTAEELAQLISFLPPTEPEDLAKRSGTLVGPEMYRRNTGDLPETARGIDYVLRLPKEYHHGKPCRVMIVLTHNTAPAEQVVGLLAEEADRHGYILAAPVWVDNFAGPYNFKGDQHYKALSVLRSVRRHFRIDDDRVFLFGYGEGASFAMDVGGSHPDQFAGVVTMGANPKNFNMFMHYWKNYQKLPLFAAFGSIAADSFQNTRLLFQDMMAKGYPALGIVYRGRGMEWFYPEVPVMFNWMEPKKRVTGNATLRTTEMPVEPWMTMRQADNRFYWVGTDNVRHGNLLPERATQSFYPAEITADIKQGNSISVRCRGLDSIVIWFDRTLIDWNQPVKVTVNGDVPPGWKAMKLKPDIEFMLEQFYQFGDRTLLYLNKLEVKVKT